TVDRAPGAERLAAGDAVERLFLLENTKRRVPGPEVETWLDGDDFLGAGGLAKPALHAEALGKAQHRAIRVIRQRPRRTGGDAGVAQRATLDIQLHEAEGRPRRQRHDIDRRGSGEAKFAKNRLEHAALGAARNKAGGLLRRDPARRGVERGAQLFRIVGLDDPYQASAEAER